MNIRTKKVSAEGGSAIGLNILALLIADYSTDGLRYEYSVMDLNRAVDIQTYPTIAPDDIQGYMVKSVIQFLTGV